MPSVAGRPASISAKNPFINIDGTDIGLLLIFGQQIQKTLSFYGTSR